MIAQNPQYKDFSDSDGSRNGSGLASRVGMASYSFPKANIKPMGNKVLLWSSASFERANLCWSNSLGGNTRRVWTFPLKTMKTDILQIAEVKGFVEESLEGAEYGQRTIINSLLWNVGLPSGKADMLANLPPRHAVDRLISRYFNSTILLYVRSSTNEPPLTHTSVIIHNYINKHYRQFWLDPEATQSSS